MDNCKKIIEKIEGQKKAIKNIGVKKIGIFGSFAKGKAGKKSDIDIIVKIENPDFDKYAAILMLLEKMLKKKIDLITETSLRPELNYIKKEAKYARI